MVDVLMNIENKVYDDFGVNCRPYGDKYILMILAMSEKIINEVPIEALTKELQKSLEARNFHMVNHAIDVVKHLDQYSYRNLGG